MGLFNKQDNTECPLAFRVRPQSLDHFAGQPELKRKISALQFSNLPHIIFFGPPGCGKTTIATILAKDSKHKIYNFNAVLGGVADLRKIIKTAIAEKLLGSEKAIIFIDEIHRFNKGQQDALLPHLECGDFVLFGATTENPNTSLNQAILSRVQRWRLNPLTENDILSILSASSKIEGAKIDQALIDYLAKHANGDARSALNQLETLIQNKSELCGLSVEQVKDKFLFDTRRYDKDSNRHYDVISAFIKSLRGSDANAAILWLAVMLDGGEDIEFIARRLIICAVEDVGNADPRALQVATSAHYGVKTIGMPEARLILAQATTYIANAPKSNASYLAINSALQFVKDNPTIEVPTHLRNHHPDKESYKYSHSFPNHWVEQVYDNTQASFYQSSGIAYEKMQDDYLKRIKAL